VPTPTLYPQGRKTRSQNNKASCPLPMLLLTIE
jgi:hypothetical protein